MNKLFFELIRAVIGTQETLSRLSSEVDWEDLLGMAEKHLHLSNSSKFDDARLGAGLRLWKNDPLRHTPRGILLRQA